MPDRVSRRTVLLIALICGTTLFAQSSSLTYPRPRKGDAVDDYFGTKVADPYRWMEDLNAPDVKQWVDAENAVTSGYLDSLPMRNQLRSRITELWNYPKVSVPFFEGGRWFYTRNTGLQRQSVFYARSSLGGAESVVLDPNTFSPDGSIALSGFAPSPDGAHLAFGQSEGGSDWSVYHVRELPGGTELPDTIRWVKFSGLSWTKDGKGFFYGRYPEPPAGKALEAAIRDPKTYYHTLGTPQTSDRMIYERPDEPALFISADLDETCRYLFITTNKGTSNKNELFVKDLGDPLAPKLDAPVTPLYPGHTAAYNPLGLVHGILYLQTDRDAPNRKIVAVPIDRPDVANWKTIVPEGKQAMSRPDSWQASWR
jgi:prolyl oligopeptidase